MHSRVLAAIGLALLLSGCVSPADDGPASGSPADGAPATDPWPAVRAAMSGVSCEAISGSDTSSNLVQLANVSYGEEAGIHGEVDVRGDLLLHARYQQGGFEMVDVRDPLHPVDLGAFDYNAEDNGDGLDVKFTPDNATALVGLGTGILMVDVRDPATAHIVGQWNFTDAAIATDPAPRVSENAHMIYAARIAGKDWVFLAPNTSTGVWVLELQGTPDARRLEYVTQTLPVQGGPLGPHDMWVGQDTQDGNWYLYSADGFHGWSAFNVNDPANPELAGGIANPAEGAYTHSIQAAWVNGRRLVATIGEIGANALKVYDATTLNAPVLLGVWQADPGAGSPAPEHNFNMVAGRLFLSYYSYGMYVIDLNQLSGLPAVGTAELAPVAHWGNNGETGGGAADIWDTVIKDGVIYLGDIEGGLVVVGFGCHDVPDPALTSKG